ncbi:MAG: TatD family hydrolase [Candidatus Omnitrophica bacterium]|nr:TatD family hydrolase [Candidatus Omnitrophota bacterium]
MLIDSHAHLDFPEFDSDRDAVISAAIAKGIEFIVNIGSSLESSQNSVELSRKYSSIYAAVGVHPHEADKFDDNVCEAIAKLAGEKKVVAIGEIGLDFYKNYSGRENQIALFRALLKVAKNIALPVVIHTREAQIETLDIIREYMPLRAVVHCFSGDVQFLNKCLDLGFFISFTCNITYKKAQNLREMLKLTPIDRLMLETDCPYLSPEGFRGKRNDPSFVKLLAEEAARIKGISFEEVERATTANVRSLFRF